MYFKIIVAALFFVSVTFADDMNPEPECPQGCGPGEEFTTCGSCDPTCKNRNPICALYCRTGCFCIAGFVRDDQGSCIRPEECPSGCSSSDGN